MRTDADSPNRFSIGCAQWLPERTAIPDLSSMLAMSYGWAPSATNEIAPARFFMVPRID